MDGWHDFFVAQAGASAVLVGLIFVGVSINLTKILAFPKIPARALESLLILLAVLVVSLLLLVPGQSTNLIGFEVLGIGVAAWATVILFDRSIWRGMLGENRRRFLIVIAMNQLAVVPYVVAGAMILSGNVDGVYWLVPGLLISLIKSIIEAWVLLVEINR